MLEEKNISDTHLGEMVLPEILKPDLENYYSQFVTLMSLYQAAADEIVTKLQTLDNEFSAKYRRNPIHTLKSRIKSPESILGKLNRKGLPVSAASIKNNLYDIAGVRVICEYIDDIYTLAGLLTSHDDIELIKTKDYIRNPKPNGYRTTLLWKYRYAPWQWTSGQVWSMNCTIRPTKRWTAVSPRSFAAAPRLSPTPTGVCRIFLKRSTGISKRQIISCSLLQCGDCRCRTQQTVLLKLL